MGGIIMIQFNLEKYLSNPKRRVVTRDGRNVRIICTDRRADEDDRSIVALVDNHAPEELILCQNDGKHFCNSNSEEDLFFVPEKKEGWINLLRSSCGEVFIGTNYPYKDEKTAKWEVSDKSNVVATCKITWEE